MPEEPSNDAPTAAEATELLVELCGLFSLGPSIGRQDGLTPLDPATAAFVAALMIPFYRTMKLRPRFGCPSLARKVARDKCQTGGELIRQYVDDVPYFMTLSLQPMLLGSAL